MNGEDISIFLNPEKLKQMKTKETKTNTTMPPIVVCDSDSEDESLYYETYRCPHCNKEKDTKRGLELHVMYYCKVIASPNPSPHTRSSTC